MIDKSLGTKRLCPSCHKKFYDLNRSPATCPYCEHEFVPKPILPSKQDQMEASQAEEVPVPQDAAIEAPEVADVADVADDVAADVPEVALEDVADVEADAAADDAAVFIEDDGDTPVEDIIPTAVDKDDEES